MEPDRHRSIEGSRGVSSHPGILPFPPGPRRAHSRGRPPGSSIEERYGTLANYVNQSILAGKMLVARRLLLPQDFQTLVTQMKTQMAAGGLLPS
jgi:hypothetical protein